MTLFRGSFPGEVLTHTAHRACKSDHLSSSCCCRKAPLLLAIVLASKSWRYLINSCIRRIRGTGSHGHCTHCMHEIICPHHVQAKVHCRCVQAPFFSSGKEFVVPNPYMLWACCMSAFSGNVYVAPSPTVGTHLIWLIRLLLNFRAAERVSTTRHARLLRDSWVTFSIQMKIYSLSFSFPVQPSQD